jgi:hypothetical protein
MATLRDKHWPIVVPLREHPLMNYHGVRSWPPSWVSTRSLPPEKLNAEIGTLENVKFYELTPNRCFLIIEFQTMRYMGSLLFEDPVLCRQIHDFFQKHLGQSIKEIGDLDVSFTL